MSLLSRKQQKEVSGKKSLSSHFVLTQLALLILPVLLTVLLLTAAFYTYGLSIFLIYFVLPMFYTVNKRISYATNGIGNPRFSYADGYKAFFGGNQGTLFGISRTSLYLLIAIVLFGLVFSSTLPSLMNLYPQASSSYEGFSALFDGETSSKDLYDYLVQYGKYMVQPVSIYVSVVMFVPLCVFFFLIDENLSDHYLATLLLPDLDLNVSPSQAKALAKGTISRKYTLYRYQQTIIHNWPYFLVFVLAYALFTWGSSCLTASDFYLMPLVFLLAPLSSMALGLFLNSFCLKNIYSILEKSQDMLLASFTPVMKDSLRDAYHSSSYLHGEESLVRGCFIKEEKKEKDVVVDDAPTGVVVDLTRE